MSVCSRSGLGAEIYGNLYVIENQMQSLETISDIESHLDLEQTEQFDVIYDLVEKHMQKETVTAAKMEMWMKCL